MAWTVNFIRNPLISDLGCKVFVL